MNIFENINSVEEVLKKDPSEVYKKMDHKTKEYYRNAIKKLSEETKISEIYIANKALDLAVEAHTSKEAHIGYYLVSDGAEKLKTLLTGIESKKSISLQDRYNLNTKKYIWTNLILTIVLSVLFGLYINHVLDNIFVAACAMIIAFIPISEIVIQTINYVLSKKNKPSFIPKMDFSMRNSKRRGYICYYSDDNKF